MTADPTRCTATRAQQTLPTAVQLIGAVRDCDRHAVAELLTGADMPALAVTLAAMVDEEQSVSDLLSWTEYDVRLHPPCDPALDRSPASSAASHGTRSRYNRGCRGVACTEAEREYQHLRYEREVAEGKRSRHAAQTSDSAATLGGMRAAS